MKQMKLGLKMGKGTDVAKKAAAAVHAAAGKDSGGKKSGKNY